MANASRLFRTYRLPERRPARFTVLRLEDRSVPSVSIPNSGFEWTPYGPSPITASTSADNPGGTVAPGNLSTGGRVDQVASYVDPTTGKTVYLAATPGGGMARGVDDGTGTGNVTWSFTTDQQYLPGQVPANPAAGVVSGVSSVTQQSLKFGSVTVSPQDPNIVYAGGGDFGYGSTIYGGIGRTFLDSYAGRGLYKSLDGGKTWARIEGPQVAVPFSSNVSVGAFDQAAVSKIVFDPRPGQQNTVFVVVNASTSYVGSPSRLQSTPMYPLTPADPGNAGYQTDGGDEIVDGIYRQNAVWRTKDGGATWENITADLKQAAPATDPGSGESRDTIPFAPISDFSLDQQNPNVAYVAVGDPNSYFPGKGNPFNGVYRTTAALADRVQNPDGTTSLSIPYTVAFGGTSGQVPGTSLGSLRVANAPSRPSTVYVLVDQYNTPVGHGLLSAFRSTDSGVNFTNVTASLPQLVDDFGAYNTSLVVDPTNPDVVYLAGRNLSGTETSFVYVGKVDPATGQFSFTPLATPLSGPSPVRSVRTISLDPAGRLVLATDGGVFRTTTPPLDAGGNVVAVTWVSLNGQAGQALVNGVWTGGLAAVETLSVALPPTNPDQFIAGTNDNGTVRFNDPGQPGGPYPKNNPGQTTPVQSTDTTLLGTPATDLTRIGGTTVYDFVDPTVVYHAGTDILSDGNQLTPVDPSRIVVKSTDGGKTWAGSSSGISAADAQKTASNGTPPLVIDPSNNKTLFFGTDKLFISENAGATWGGTIRGSIDISTLPFVSGSTGPLSPSPVTAIGVGRFDDRIIYVAVQQRVNPLGPPYTNYGPALYRINTNIVIPSVPEPRWYDVSPDYFSRPGSGTTLPGIPMTGTGVPNPNVPQPNLLTGRITSIVVDPFDSNTVVITVDTPGVASTQVDPVTGAVTTTNGLAGVGRVWRSTDGGANWTDITGTLPGGRAAGRPNEGLAVYAAVLDPNRLVGASDDDIYIGTSNGVYKLSDPEKTIPDPNNPTGPQINNPYNWVKVGGDSLPDVQVTGLALNTTTGLLAAATYGRGVWQFQIRPLITGFVFTDTNGNGIKDPGESSAGGVTVIAFNQSSQAEQANTITRQQTGDTSAIGFYEFRSLPGSPDLPGQYQIELGNSGSQYLTTPDRIYNAQTLPATGGVVQTTTVQAGADARGGLPGADLGVFATATITGVLFDDTNGDGIRETGEPARQGVVVSLIDPRTGAVAINPRTGLAVPDATTDATGTYTFTGLVPLQDRTTFDPVTGYKVYPYGVRQTLPSGAVQTTGGVTATAVPVPVTITSGAPSTQNVGSFTLVTIQGTVFDDTNGDGIREGEPRLGGVVVKLLQPGPDGKLGTADDGPTTTRTSDPNGSYSFTNLGPGTYYIQEDPTTVPAGYKLTSANPQGPVTPTSGQATGLTFDFGNFRDAGLSGVVFEDDNGDGRQQPTETRPVAGATVVLIDPGPDGQTGTPALDADNKVLATTTTASDGSYQFTGLQPLTSGNSRPYAVRVIQPNSLFVQTSADARPALSSGIVTGGQNLGYFRRTTISGFAFEDVNGNGVQDAGEPAAANFPVSLLNSNDPTQVVGVATTDATGQYRFAYDPANPTGFSGGPLQLNAGTQGPGGAVIAYRVAVNLPNVVQTNAPGDLVLTSGVPAAGPTLALFRTVGFAGFVFDDTNGDGSRAAGEPGVAGLTVQLVTPSGAVAVNQATGLPIQTTTAANGSYTIQAPNGTFTVRLVQSELDARKLVATNAPPAPVLTSSGLVIPQIDLGTFKTFTVAGTVYLDANGNGRQDTGESGQGGLTVQLLTPAGAPTAYTTTTDANGKFTLAGVGPVPGGVYTLKPVLPAGVYPTSPAAGTLAVAATSGQVVNPATTTFGIFTGATIRGTVFEDLNQNGAFDAGEPASAGWTVVVKNSSGQVIQTSQTTSDASGAFTVSAVPPGAATVELAARDGWRITLPSITLSSALTSGSSVTVGQLGGVRLGSVSGAVFNDANRNGRQDESETGVAGVTVELVQNGAVVASQVSGSDGSFQFLNVQGGSYTLRLNQGTIAAGRVQTGPQNDTQTYTLAVTAGSGTAGNALTGENFGVAGRKRYAVAADGGGGPRVQVYDAVSGVKVSDQFVYEQSFTGGVRVASADVNGDGVDDLITVAGKGGGPRVRVIDGATGATLYDYFAYEPSFRDGLFVAAADVNGDGYADIITGTDSGGGPRVTVFSGKDGTQLLDFFAFDPGTRSGVRIGVGDVNGDGKAEIIAATGAGTTGEVRVFASDGRLLNSFTPLDPSFTGGLYVAGGAVDPTTGRASVLVGSGAGYADQGYAFVFDGLTGQQIFQLEAFPPANQGDPVYTGDVRVASFDTTGDGVPDIVIASGAGVRSEVRILDGLNRREVTTFFPFEPAFLGGLFIG